MNATELLEALTSLPGARPSGGDGNGVAATSLVNGVEYARATAVDEPKLRSAFRARQGGGATPLVLLGDDPEQAGFVRVLGPGRDGALRRVRTESLLGVVQRTLQVKRLQAVRLLAEELDRLDTERIAGLKVRGLGTEHLYDVRLPASERWAQLDQLAAGLDRAGGWREVLTGLGYSLEPLRPEGYLARAREQPVAVVFPRANAWMFARLDDEGRLPEGALVALCRELGAPYGILAAGTRLRLLQAGEGEAGAATRYLELDAAALEPERRALLGLLAPAFLADGGLAGVLQDARDHGQALRRRLDRVLRQHVLPVLGRELGRWAQRDGRDVARDDVREELQAAVLLWVFRALFLLYAESAGHLPVEHPTYRQRSLTRTAERAWEERDEADAMATSLWDDVATLVRRMRTGQSAWGLPPYNGDLFAGGAVAGAAVLEQAEVPDDVLGPALWHLARDEDDPRVGVDFSGLEIGHLGYVYEGLLSLRLAVADRDLAYDERADRYLPVASGEPAEVRGGELLWLTDEGGRKGGGVYYTRTELVRHLVRGAVGPAFDRHLARVEALAAGDPAAAAAALFDFAVLDPACGSAHFLVEVVDDLADRIARLLGRVALPAVSAQLEALRRQAAAYGAGIEDTALLKRLVLKRCVYGVDLSAMGTEIAKVSLWLASFVPGLSLAYLDHNVQRGNALLGVASAEDVGADTIFGDALRGRLRAAGEQAAALRLIDDSTPDAVSASRDADAELRRTVAGARRLFDLWTAEPLGLPGARDEAERLGGEVLAGEGTPLGERADALAAAEHALHWPLAFAEVFARERPGFDAVVGNPPWDEVTVEELGFYGRYRPGLRGLPERARLVALEELRGERPELEVQLAAERGRMARLRTAFGAAGGYAGGVGDPDLYKLFCQRYGRLLREGAAMGVVLPRSVLAAKGSHGFREWLWREAPPRRVDVLLNRARWAFDMEPRYSVALLLAQRGGQADAVEAAGVADSAPAFARQVAAPGVALRRPALGPLLEVPLLGDQAAADLLAKLRAGPPFPLGGGRWRCFGVAEFHETNDAALWRDAADGLPLWKGESFDQFAPHGAGERPCPDFDLARAKAAKPRPGSGSLLADRVPLAERRRAVERALAGARVAFRDVTNRTNSRTVIACLVPPRHFLTNKAPYLAFVDGGAREQAACLGLMNSLPFDWQARRFVEINLNFFVLEGLRLPELDDAAFAALADAAARLSCPDERFAAWAAEAGVPAGPLADDERAALRVEVDAWAAHAYGLTEDELELLFQDFTLDAVPLEHRERVVARLAELPG